MHILIGADICVTDKDMDKFIDGKIEEILDERLINILNQADYRIFNLEGPITVKSKPIEKFGPNLKMPLSTINGIKQLHPSLLTLANNHIMDYGEDGLMDTISTLREAQIDYVGVKVSKEENIKYYTIDRGSFRIAVYACAEHEFSIAENDRLGANPYDPIDTIEDIRKLKSIFNYVFVLYHGGKECYRYPSPELQHSFRAMARAGADLVVAQHTHCIGCYELYQNSYLIYGQGNFIFDLKNDEYWKSGMLLDLEISEEKYHVNFIPFTRQNGLIKISEENTILKEFFDRSQKVHDSSFVYKKYKEFINNHYVDYLAKIKRENITLKVLRKIGAFKIYNHLYFRRNELTTLLNYVSCESHRESLIESIKYLMRSNGIENKW